MIFIQPETWQWTDQNTLSYRYGDVEIWASVSEQMLSHKPDSRWGYYVQIAHDINIPVPDGVLIPADSAMRWVEYGNAVTLDEAKAAVEVWLTHNLPMCTGLAGYREIRYDDLHST